MPNDNAGAASSDTAGPPAGGPRARDLAHKHAAALHSVTYTGHTKLIFLWPIIAMGYLFWPLAKWGWASPAMLGWIYILTAVVCILAVTVDLSRNYGFFWLVSVALVVVAGRYLEKVNNITLLGDLYRGFANMQVQYDRATGMAISILLSIFFVIGVIWAYGNNRYTMTHNEVVHHVWGRGDTSIGRGARVITMLYPDFFEFLMCLAGTIVVYDNTGRTTIARTEHVPLLPFKARKIDKLLESVEVTHDMVSDTAAADHAASNADDWH